MRGNQGGNSQVWGSDVAEICIHSGICFNSLFFHHWTHLCIWSEVDIRHQSEDAEWMSSLNTRPWDSCKGNFSRYPSKLHLSWSLGGQTHVVVGLHKKEKVYKKALQKGVSTEKSCNDNSLSNLIFCKKLGSWKFWNRYQSLGFYTATDHRGHLCILKSI